jgi:hypothetical protein
VEGIGYLGGLLEWPCEIIDGPLTALSCFRENNSVLYIHPTYSDSICDIIDGINNLHAGNHTVSLSPNPFHMKAVLRFGDLNLQTGKKVVLNIFNSLGVLERREILNANSLAVGYILRRNDLTNGIYIYELRTERQELISYGKFIIN